MPTNPTRSRQSQYAARTKPGTAAWADEGQALAEAPIAVIVLIALIILLLQPTIVLFDRIIINNAAAELARVEVTAMDEVFTGGSQEGHRDAFVERRMRAIPASPYFLSGTPKVKVVDTGNIVNVEIAITAKPLPVLGSAASWLGTKSREGDIVITGKAAAPKPYTALDQIKGVPDSWKWF